MKKVLIIIVAILIVVAGAMLWHVEKTEAPTTTTSKADKIRVTSPTPHQEITSPLTITGEAVGTWMFEASFPVILADGDGKIIAEGQAKAQGDWMTEKFVPFTATLTFTKPTGSNNRGTLIFKKDNPSGLPQNDDAFEVPIVFK
jgi:hypothetical protein